MSPAAQLEGSLATAVSAAARTASQWLLDRQYPDGYWWADLTADTTLESDWILLQLWLCPPEQGVWNPPDRVRINRAVDSILSRQLPGGGFNIYPQGPADLSATVKAYFALKLAGVPAGDEKLAKTRQVILDLGGIQAANSYVKLNLSLFGLYPREGAPAVPPELMLLPANLIYQMSSWTRAIVIPLSVVHAFNPQRPVPAGFNLNELFLPGAGIGFPQADSFWSWRKFFYGADRVLKWWERRGVRSIRQRALKKAEEWILAHAEYTDGVGGIYPPMMYVIMALDLLGYPADHPHRIEAQRQFDRLMVDDHRGFFFQPCFSVVWDTAIAAFALGSGAGNPPAGASEALRRTSDWLLSKEVRRKGDWSIKRPKTEPSGWYFEFANEFYPDIDDTAMVLLALNKSVASSVASQQVSTKRALEWLLHMQSRDGGWAAFDVDNNWEALSYVPFADHNAMLDPSCPDITGRVLEALCAYGFAASHPAVAGGVEYLLKSQEADGSWYGRWGVNYVYGTFLALRGLAAAGYSNREAPVQRALEWVRSIQNFDGGWGESCASYDRNQFVSAPSTPSQTAWAILALLAGGDTSSTTLHDGIEYLLRTQTREGSWEEQLATGTGFPKVFYLCYHLYRHSFPLLALNCFVEAKAAARG